MFRLRGPWSTGATWLRKQGAAGVRGHNTKVHPFTSLCRPESEVLFQQKHFPVYWLIYVTLT